METTNLITIEQTSALTVFTTQDEIESIIAQVEREALSFVPDLSTFKGRNDVKSMAYKVAQTKTYLDGLGKNLTAEYKEIPKKIDANRKLIRDRLDELRDKVRQPLTDWEAEQERERLAAEAIIAAKELAVKIDSDHEIALLLNDKFDSERAAAKAKAAQEQRERDEKIAREAAAKALADAAEKQRAEIAEARAAQERSERERIEAIQRAEEEKKAALARAEQARQEAIKRERGIAELKEKARLAAEQRERDEVAKREADKEHRRGINSKSVAELVEFGIPLDCARKCVEAIARGVTSSIKINY